MTAIQPRWYQAAAEEAVVEYLSNGWCPGKFPLVVLPTGAGKTIVFSRLCQRFFAMGQPSILILAHRKELILQAEEKLLTVWPEAPVGVYAASAKRRELKHITVSSRDTYVGLLKSNPRWDIIIIDEGHNISKKEKTQYKKIIDQARHANPNVVVIGFTATPYRMDAGLIYGKGEIFTELVFSAPIKRLIEEGYLCDLIAKQVDDQAVIDTKGLRKTAGDYNQKQLAERAGDVVAAAVAEWYEHAHLKGRKCSAFFCVTVDHAKAVSDILWRHYQLDVPVVTGETKQDERDFVLKQLADGEIPGVANVGVLTEGYDNPRLDCIAILRATASLGLYVQIIGRGLRPHPDKDNTLILDFGGNISRFGPIDVAQPAAKREGGEQRCKTCPECQTICKAFAPQCLECGYEFNNPPTRICPGCGEHNAPKASKCIACGHLFVSHEAIAAEGDIITSKPRPQWYTVSNVSAQSMRSQNGNPYLKVVYQVGLSHAFFKNLMIGFPGKLGRKAWDEWREITVPGTKLPGTALSASQMAQKGCLKQVEKIQVDMNSKWKDILHIKYKEDNESEVA